jgi:hypothetical protein
MTLKRCLGYPFFVTSAVSEFHSDSEASELKDIERLLRWLFRRVATPAKIASDPFARSICRATGVANPANALRGIVFTALRGHDPIESRQRDVLLALSFEGRDVSTVAERLHFSRRHVLRVKSEAIAAVAGHVRALLASGPEELSEAPQMSGDPFEDLAEMVSKAEPKVAASISRLGEFATSARSQLLALRAKVDHGVELDASAYAEFAKVPEALVSACIEFSLESGGADPISIDREAALLAGPNQFDDATKFEIEHLAFVRARQCDRPLEMRAVAYNLARLAAVGSSAAGKALLCRADASLRLGDIAEARALLEQSGRLTFHRNDVQLFAATMILNAKIALFEGDAARAEDLAVAAYIVLQGHRDAYGCQMLIAEARLALGRAWAPPDEAAALRPNAWSRIAMDVEHARTMLRDGDVSGAEHMAGSARSRAVSLEYAGLATLAAATLAACAAARGDDAGARRWDVDTLAGLLETNDFLLAARVCRDRPLVAGVREELAEVVRRRLCVSIPQMLADDARQQGAFEFFVTELLDVLADRSRPLSALDEALERVCETESAFAYFGSRTADDVERVASLTAIALADRREWAGRNVRAREAVEYAVAHLHAGRPRVFAV